MLTRAVCLVIVMLMTESKSVDAAPGTSLHHSAFCGTATCRVAPSRAHLCIYHHLQRRMCPCLPSHHPPMHRHTHLRLHTCTSPAPPSCLLTTPPRTCHIHRQTFQSSSAIPAQMLLRSIET